MNKENAKEFLPLIQAMADGKTIQYQIGHELWHDVEWIDTIEGYSSDYRIKPEPRTFKMWLYHSTGRMYPLVDEIATGETGEWEHITVREVLQ